jgi:hypothetical protein
VDTAGEVVFMLVVLKIPMVYLGIVLWYAVKADPAPDGGEEAGVLAPVGPCGWGDWRDRRVAGARGRRPLRPSGRTAMRHAPRLPSRVPG